MLSMACVAASNERSCLTIRRELLSSSLSSVVSSNPVVRLACRKFLKAGCLLLGRFKLPAQVSIKNPVTKFVSKGWHLPVSLRISLLSESFGVETRARNPALKKPAHFS
jgi:hypothetical protein